MISSHHIPLQQGYRLHPGHESHQHRHCLLPAEDSRKDYGDSGVGEKVELPGGLTTATPPLILILRLSRRTVRHQEKVHTEMTVQPPCF